MAGKTVDERKSELFDSMVCLRGGVAWGFYPTGH
jgi:hypothetical protein